MDGSQEAVSSAEEGLVADRRQVVNLIPETIAGGSKAHTQAGLIGPSAQPVDVGTGSIRHLSLLEVITTHQLAVSGIHTFLRRAVVLLLPHPDGINSESRARFAEPPDHETGISSIETNP